MKARVQIEVTFELGYPEDYPEEVENWTDAAHHELDYLYVRMSEGVQPEFTIGEVLVEGNDEFIRLEGDDQEGECRE